MRGPYAMNASDSAASYLLSSLGGLGLGSGLLDGSLGSLLGSLLGELSGTLSLLGSLSLSGGLASGLGLSSLGGLGSLGLLSLLELGGSGATELVGEALDASTGVDELLLAGVERVALVAKLNLHLGHGSVRLEGVAAGARHRALDILGMDTLLHGRTPYWSGAGYRSAHKASWFPTKTTNSAMVPRRRVSHKRFTVFSAQHELDLKYQLHPNTPPHSSLVCIEVFLLERLRGRLDLFHERAGLDEVERVGEVCQVVEQMA